MQIRGATTAMLEIPLLPSPNQSFDVVLGTQTAGLRVYWLPLGQSWFLDVHDFNGNAIATGRRMAVNVRLVQTSGFDGDLAVIATHDGNVQEVGREGWGDTHNLYWLTETEVESIEWVA